MWPRILGVILSAMTILSACTVARSGTPTPAATRPPALSLATITALDQLATEALASNGAGLSIAVDERAQVVYAHGFGEADIVANRPVHPETPFAIASITKQFTAAAILQLVDKHRLTLDSTLSQLLPQGPIQDSRITLKMLLNHTSGIGNYTRGPDYLKLEPHDQSESTMLDFIASRPRQFEPGESFAYNNSGYYLLGIILERVTGKPYGDYLMQHLVQPLGLMHTRYCGGGLSTPDGAARYASGGAHSASAAPVSTTVAFAAGGLCASASDLLRWQYDLRTGHVVTPRDYAMMTGPTTAADGKVIPYGFGLETDPVLEGDPFLAGHPAVWHDGGGPGVSSDLIKDDVGIAVLSNSDTVNADAVASRVAQLVLKK